MELSFETAIALRYLKSKRHGLFAFLTTLIAIGGVTLGVAALIVTLSVMNGFRSDIQEKTLGIQPHIMLLGTEGESPIGIEAISDRVRALREVRAVSPFVLGQALLKSKHGAQGVVLRGIVPESEFAVTGIEKTLLVGQWSDLGKAAGKNLILGKELARNLGVSLGEEIVLFSPSETPAAGALGAVPRLDAYKVSGLFNSGYYEYDANLALTSLENAREVFSVAGPSGLGIKLENLDDADAVAPRVAEAAGMKFWSRSWQSMNRNLFEALKLEKVVMTIILTMVVLVASFTIISNLILMTIEKSKDIGILKALGAGRASIRKIFLYAGMILGGAGILLGAALGVALVNVLDRTRWIKLPADVYYLDTLPVKLSAFDVGMVLIGAFLITAASALYPAARAASVDPVDAIRYG